MQNHTFALLQKAARDAGTEAVKNSNADCVTVSEQKRTLIELAIPPTAYPAAADHTTRPGWFFKDGAAWFDGVRVPIAGRKYDVLKFLAEADGFVRTKQLWRAWGRRVSDSQIRGMVQELRAALAEQFPAGEAIETSKGEGYRLILM